MDVFQNNFLFNLVPILKIGFKVLTPLLFIGYLYAQRINIKEGFKKALGINAIVFAAVSLIVFIIYVLEFYVAYRSGYLYEENQFATRVMGPFSWAYWLMTSIALVSLLLNSLLFFQKFRNKTWFYVLVWVLSITSFGRLMEKLTILIISLHRDFIPSSWAMHSPNYKQLILGSVLFLVLIGFIYFYAKRKS